ncbi:hypothetical protein HK101_001511 [Irineochytrium annulatum]|nr:hypothetical protein HK101_001511 [Irineochytrium annulatum]
MSDTTAQQHRQRSHSEDRDAGAKTHSLTETSKLEPAAERTGEQGQEQCQGQEQQCPQQSSGHEHKQQQHGGQHQQQQDQQSSAPTKVCHTGAEAAAAHLDEGRETKMMGTQAQATPTSVSEGGVGSKRRTILVALDSTPESHQALAWSLANLVRKGDRISLASLGFVPQSSWTDYFNYLAKGDSYGFEKIEELESKATELALRSIAQATKVIEAHGQHLKEDYEIVHDVLAASKGSMDPRDFIIKMCQSRDADVLCVGSRELTKLQRIVTSSVSEHLARHAPCPVVIVRGVAVEEQIRGGEEDTVKSSGVLPTAVAVEVKKGGETSGKPPTEDVVERCGVTSGGQQQQQSGAAAEEQKLQDEQQQQEMQQREQHLQEKQQQASEECRQDEQQREREQEKQQQEQQRQREEQLHREQQEERQKKQAEKQLHAQQQREQQQHGGKHEEQQQGKQEREGAAREQLKEHHVSGSRASK